MFRIVCIPVFLALSVCGGRIAREREPGDDHAALMSERASPLQMVLVEENCVQFVRQPHASWPARGVGTKQPFVHEQELGEEPVSLYEAFRTWPPVGGWNKMRARLLFVSLGAVVGGTAMFLGMVGMMSMFSYGVGIQRGGQRNVRFEAESKESIEESVGHHRSEAIGARPSLRIVETSTIGARLSPRQQLETRQQRVARLYGSASRGLDTSEMRADSSGGICKTLSVVPGQGGPQYKNSYGNTTTSSALLSETLAASTRSEGARTMPSGNPDMEFGQSIAATEATYAFGDSPVDTRRSSRADLDVTTPKADGEEEPECEHQEEPERQGLEEATFGNVTTIGGNRRRGSKVLAGANQELKNAMLKQHKSNQ